MENKNSKKKPFFATFLEKQIKDPENVKGGSITSVKIDDVTSLVKDQVIVTAALEDSVSTPLNDNVTLKYPSDGDDHVLEVEL
ncbi:microviridin/marinostatin family tricyclic proteinase inhibitor [Chryseobacterium arthrosphaerae]|uniref:Microviridin/marinostatin family tricyclic proteinase inhibitor n=1 Tax=Chryseobacterium arthrosphaerae TaxID=651561 RepID=A0A1B8ZT13_9FLAO|nr:microviridin/marinostatin family tricyclic proteinase inhibitor [Chryseobacterium arthrosphaerae]AYZ13171.1 serine endopeptidase [Chryseobacterium arthrosphaerae]MDG4652914.1 microviridin/marinostatin family tricyclic proteinase inhibitor [Chryseobacterium arthrosphaerae]OCA74735.1 serine endopeptidase [Chryseobacterium arthrosphaerae]QUY53974.1 microviridin/marinostatin family tricyclic proteinase inhibitor [Chryseobacterium arthrosphaerae]UEQ78448.1 microviridin/marinostatin family tricyc